MRIRIGQVRAAFDSGSLNLILFPTEKCNFRCTYCYEDFAVGRMQPDVVSGVKHLLARRAPELHTLVLSWFGGEPLLAHEILVDISAHARALADTFGIAYQGNITTNGYLLDRAMLRRLVDVGVSQFQISLDGAGEQHDRTRKKASGAGTFDRIWANVLGIRNSDRAVEVVLRVHISPENRTSIDTLIDLINQELQHDERFTIYFKTLAHLGGPVDNSFPIYTDDEGPSVAQEVASRLANPAQAYKAPLDEPYVCYASKPNSLMIRANGTIGKCTVALDDPRNHIGRLQPDGSLDIVQEKVGPWVRGFASLDELELGCPYQGLRRTQLPLVDSTAAGSHCQE